MKKPVSISNGKRFAIKRPKFQIGFYFACLGDEPHEVAIHRGKM
jgi:hypothetical protein